MTTVYRRSAGAWLDYAGGSVSSGGGADPSITHGQQMNATNTGIAYASLTAASLTTQAGGIYNTPGQVVSNIRFTDNVVINAANVTMRNCQIEASGSFTRLVTVAGNNCLLENCTILAPTGSGYQGIWVTGTGLTVRRCNISKCENNMTIEGSSTTVEYSYLHDSSNASNPSGHRDCIEVYAGNDVTLRMSRLVHPAGETSVVNIAPYYSNSSVLRCTISDSFLDGGNMHVLVDLQSTGAVQNTRVLRNKMGGHTDPAVVGRYFALNNSDGRSVVNTEGALTANPEAILWPTSGADANYWDECSDLSPNRTGQVIVP